MFTPDGKTLVSSSADGTIRLWNPAQQRAREIISIGPANQPLTFDLDPSGKFLFAAGHCPLIFVVRLPEPAAGEPGKIAGDLPPKNLDPDRRAAEYVLSNGGTIRVIEQKSGKEGHIGAVADLPRESFRLTWVGLRGKQVSDVGLASFKDCDCKNLTGLDLGGTQVSDVGLAHFKNCKNLTELWLHDTKVGDAGLASFKDSKNLTLLWVQRTQVGDAGLASFKECKNLKELDLSKTQVSDAGLAYFNDCKNLTRLVLGFTQVSDAGLSYFKDCQNLKELWLHSTQVTGICLVHFNDCKNLTFLNLSNTQVTVELDALKHWTNLREIHLHGTKVGDAGLAQLKDCKNLTALVLTGTKVTSAGLADLKKALPKCNIDIPPEQQLPPSKPAAEKPPGPDVNQKGTKEAAKIGEKEQTVGGKVFLSDLQESDWKGHKEFMKNGQAHVAGGIRVNDEKSAKGLWMHPPSHDYSSIKYKIDGLNAQTLKAKVAINDSAHPKGAASHLTFEVWGDGRVLWSSKPAKFAQELQECSVKIEGCQVLELRVVCKGKHDRAHAVWLDPYLVNRKKATPAPPPLPPANGFIPLFNGKDLTGWVGANKQPAAWNVFDGDLVVVPGKGHISTTQNFGPNFQLHVEFNVPLEANRKGQARGNSGIFLLGRHEIQILDSFGNPQAPELSCGALYGQVGPTKNVCKPPNEWQTFDITFRAPRAAGKLQPGELSVIHNGVLVIDKCKVGNPTGGGQFPDVDSIGPIVLQEHGSGVRFRNLKIKTIP